MADTNKVKFGLKNVHYALATETTTGTLTFSTVVAIPGAVNLTLDAAGAEAANFYADDIIYYVSPARNNGYTGTLEIAKIPDAFRTDILGDITDAKGMLLENAEATSKQFALLFEFNGDKETTRHIMYNCTAARPSVGSATIEDSATPQTETLNLTAIPMKYTYTTGTASTDYFIVKAKADKTAASTAFNAWFTTVQTPNITGA